MPVWLEANLVSVLNGFAIGFLLFILAVGLSLVFGMMDVLNLAHGALFLGGAYLGATFAGGGASWGGFLGALAVAALGASYLARKKTTRQLDAAATLEAQRRQAADSSTQ